MERTINIEDLNSKQYEIFTDIIKTPASKTKYYIIRASRQSGKTFLIDRISIYFSFELPNLMGAFVSASYKQFTKVFKEITELCPELIQHIDKGNSVIYFINGTSLHFFTARNYNAITGNTFDFLICDEVALFPQGALGYITPVLSAKRNAKAVFSSTPRGKGDFWDLCQAGMDETKQFFKHYRMMYTDNKEYDLREVEEKRKTMPESIFRSEYLGEFVFGKSSVFGEFTQYQKIITWPEYDTTKQYFFGIDWAGTGEDSTILCIIDNEGKVVLFFEPMTTSIPDQVNLMTGIINKYHAVGYAECNGLGIGGTQMLQLKTNDTYQFWMTNESKNELVTNFIIDLKQNFISLPTPDLYSKLDSEMCSYIVQRTNTGKLTYSHEKGFHDDSVDALLIAHKAWKESLHLKPGYAEPDEKLRTDQEIIESDFYENEENINIW
jgi:hypothetical protein